MTAVEQFPEFWNTGVRVTEENRKCIYCVLKDMLNTQKLLMVIVFVSITIISSKAMSLPAWFLPAFLILMFGSIIFFIIKLVHEK
jgi:hypothetical protein